MFLSVIILRESGFHGEWLGRKGGPQWSELPSVGLRARQDEGSSSSPSWVTLDKLGNCLSFNFFILHVCLWLHWGFVAVHRLFSSCGDWGYTLILAHRLLIVVGISCKTWAPGAWASVVVVHGLVACGIFPDQGLNPCLLHWQADS